MFSKAARRTVAHLAFAAAAIGSVAAVATVASSASTAGADQSSYVPMQGISHQVGSKSAIGYFIRESGACQVVLMISEKTDPESGTMPSAARLRLALMPGQVVGLDSEEGRSIDFTCGADADTDTLEMRSGATGELAVLTN